MLPTTRFEVYNNDKDKNPRRQVPLSSYYFSYFIYNLIRSHLPIFSDVGDLRGYQS